MPLFIGVLVKSSTATTKCYYELISVTIVTNINKVREWKMWFTLLGVIRENKLVHQSICETVLYDSMRVKSIDPETSVWVYNYFGHIVVKFGK